MVSVGINELHIRCEKRCVGVRTEKQGNSLCNSPLSILCRLHSGKAHWDGAEGFIPVHLTVERNRVMSCDMDVCSRLRRLIIPGDDNGPSPHLNGFFARLRTFFCSWRKEKTHLTLRVKSR